MVGVLGPVGVRGDDRGEQCGAGEESRPPRGAEGLDRGADDYLGKPFDLGELAARLRALVRRANGRTEPSVTIGPLAITLATRQVTLKGQEIELSRREFAVLEVLAVEAKGAR